MKEKVPYPMGDILIGGITITKSFHRPTNGFVGTLFIYAEETAMKKARQIVKPSATFFSKNHSLFLAFVLQRHRAKPIPLHYITNQQRKQELYSDFVGVVLSLTR